MTRKTKRDLENDLEELNGKTDTGDENGMEIVWEHPVTGEYYKDKELTEGPVDPEDPDPIMVIFQEGEVMYREQAEEEDREIIGPAEDAPGDTVRVVPKRLTDEDGNPKA